MPSLLAARQRCRTVARISTAALAQRPHRTAPIEALATLQGVGPATASAVGAVLSPDLYPFCGCYAARVSGRLAHALAQASPPASPACPT